MRAVQQRFEHFLVTTDFSAQGDRAVAVAFRLAQDHGARVTLCHVLDAVRPPNPLYAHYYPTELFKPEVAQRAEENALRELRARAPADVAGVAHDCVVSHGDPADEIVRHAEERGCDLILMCTHGRTGLRHVLIGSVAEKVLRRARCSVMVVR
jgi:nucleotide-binding universal stress UspA family protein